MSIDRETLITNISCLIDIICGDEILEIEKNKFIYECLNEYLMD